MTMSRFLEQTLSDMRNGRETWRVIAVLAIPAFALAVLQQLL